MLAIRLTLAAAQGAAQEFGVEGIDCLAADAFFMPAALIRPALQRRQRSDSAFSCRDRSGLHQPLLQFVDAGLERAQTLLELRQRIVRRGGRG